MTEPRIANLSDLGEPIDRSHGERYASRHFAVGRRLGTRKIGSNLTEVPPGKTAFPYHFHRINEEMFLVLSGAGEVRTPAGTRPLGPGDILFCPAGPEGAHQIFNTGSEPLRYLALSTYEDPELVEYPDSGKYAVTVGRKPGGTPAESDFRAVAFVKDQVDYWAGED